jgi:hypothetical protein
MSFLTTHCANQPLPDTGAPAREVVMSYDDNRVSANLAFPNRTYETLVRFQLPPGKHRPLRLWAMVSSAGMLELTLYANGPFEAPAEIIRSISWTITADDASTGKDGRWLVSELRAVEPLEGVIWLGVRKLGGDPTLWTSAASSGHTFLRDRAPGNSMGILPVKRTPMLRLELTQ